MQLKLRELIQVSSAMVFCTLVQTIINSVLSQVFLLANHGTSGCDGTSPT